MSKVEFRFPDCGAVAHASLENTAAPRACEALWEMLAEPIEADLEHAFAHLPELWFFIPPVTEFPLEHTTALPKAGNVMIFHYDEPGAGNYTTPLGREMAFDIGIFYAQSFVTVPLTGWVAGTHVATLDNVNELKPALIHALHHGRQRVIAARSE